MILDPIKAAVAPYMLAIKAGAAVVLLAGLFIGGCNHDTAHRLLRGLEVRMKTQ